MTKSEFETKLNEKYKESLLFLTDSETLKQRFEKFADENRQISNQDLIIQSLLLSAEFSKKLIYSVLTDILEFSD